MTPAGPGAPARRLLGFLSAAVLTAIAAVLAVVLPATMASAATAPAAGTRVGAHHPGMIFTIGFSRPVPAVQGRGEGCPQPSFALGACFAAEDAGSDLADAGADGDDVDPGCDDSFAPATKVLLASGAAIPISQLKPGDKVLATSVKTGKTRAEPVKAVIVEHDNDLYDLTVKAAGKTAVIQTTSHHRFWDQTTRRWTYAGALAAGDLLHSRGHAQVSVISGYVPADATGWMWDLTVANDHDFYIDIATTTTAVLVHNCPTNLGRGSTGRTDPANLREQLAMEEAQSNPAAGRVLTNITMNDARWSAEEGWVKMQQNVNGVIIHYVYNPLMDAVDDYKFVG